MSKRQRASVTINRTRVTAPATGEVVPLNARTEGVWIENRSSKKGILVGVLFGTSGAVTMNANLDEATTILGPGMGRYIGRPNYQDDQFPGNYTHVFVRASATFAETLDVEELT